MQGRRRAPEVVNPLFTEDFADANLDTRGWYDGNAATISTTEHPTGLPGSLEGAFSLGGTAPSWIIKRHLFPATETVYLSYWVKYSTNWVGSGQLYHPHEWQFLSDADGDWAGLSANILGVYVEHSYSNGGIPRLICQDSLNINYSQGALPNDLTATTELRSVCGCNGLLEAVDEFSCYPTGEGSSYYNAKTIDAASVAFQPTAGAGYKNNWNHVEAYFQMNSILNGTAQANGLMRYWFNGTLMIDRNDIVYRTAQRPTLKFHQVSVNPYIGDGAPAAQTVWYADLLVATERPTPPPLSAVGVNFSVQPSGEVEDTVIAPPPQVVVVDALGNIVTDATNTISLAIVSGTGTLGGTTSKAAVAGVATFTDLTIDTPGTFTLQATSAGLAPATSVNFVITTAGGGGVPVTYTNRPANTVTFREGCWRVDLLSYRQANFDFGVNDGGTFSLGTDPTAPGSSALASNHADYQRFGRAHCPAGVAGGNSSWNLKDEPPAIPSNARGYYHAEAFRYTSPWDWHNTLITKHHEFWINTDSCMVQCNPLTSSTTSGFEVGHVVQAGGADGFHTSGPTFALGVWHWLEWYIDFDNKRLYVWCDGSLCDDSGTRYASGGNVLDAWSGDGRIEMLILRGGTGDNSDFLCYVDKSWVYDGYIPA